MSDPGQGKEVSFESERLNPGQEYWFQLKSCNIINCSKESVEITINVKGKVNTHCKTYCFVSLQIDFFANRQRHFVYY